MERRRSRRSREAEESRNRTKGDQEDEAKAIRDKSVKELVKMGFKGEMDMDAFAEKITKFMKDGEASTSGSKKGRRREEEEGRDASRKRKFTETEEERADSRDQIVHVEGLDIKVKPFQPPAASATSVSSAPRRSRSPPMRRRAVSPGVNKAFFDGNSSDESPRRNERGKSGRLGVGVTC